jgi:hypothetical protein
LVSQFYSNCIMGVEVFDAEGKIALRKLIKSKIFKIFTITYIQAAITLPLAYFVLTSLSVAGSVLAVVEIVGISIAVHLSTFVGLYFFMRKTVRLSVSWKSIAKYVCASILMGTVLFIVPSTSTLLFTVAKAVLGLAIYIAVLLAIDNQARELLKLIILEINGVLKQLISRHDKFED